MATQDISIERRDRFKAATSWLLWTARNRVIALVVLVDAGAVVASVVALSHVRLTASDLLRFGLLAALSVVYLELSRQVEARRRLLAVGDSSHIDVSSVWVLAGAIVLPSGLAVLLAALTYMHLWTRSWRPVATVRAHRVLYSGAAVLLSCLAVTAVHGTALRTSTPGAQEAVAGVVIAMLTYRIVNRLLIHAVLALSTGTANLSKLAGTWSGNALEFSTLALGGITAELVIRAPWLVAIVLPAVFLMQYHALIGQLVNAATIDTKTELLNASAWRQLAIRELDRAARQQSATAVLVIDMDRFKQINDTLGHLAGDAVLKAVGEALADELRGYDAVGRFGGEEFVALLPGVEAADAAGVGERVRKRIAALNVQVERQGATIEQATVTASIGVAAAAGGSGSLDDLLEAADAAMYCAKAAGRNTVRLAPPHSALRVVDVA